MGIASSLVALVFLVACGSLAACSVHRSARDGLDSEVAAATDLADSGCACRDQPCATAAIARWQARGVPTSGVPRASSVEEAVAKQDARLFACTNAYLGAPTAAAMIAKARLLADRICACSDDACTATVHDESDRYFKYTFSQHVRSSEAEVGLLSAQMQRIEECRARNAASR